MEQMFQRNCFVFFSEFRQFSFYFQKTTTSFLKLNWMLVRSCVFLLRSLGHLFFVGPSLYKWHSPYRKVRVEKTLHINQPRLF